MAEVAGGLCVTVFVIAFLVVVGGEAYKILWLAEKGREAENRKRAAEGRKPVDDEAAPWLSDGK